MLQPFQANNFEEADAVFAKSSENVYHWMWLVLPENAYAINAKNSENAFTINAKSSENAFTTDAVYNRVGSAHMRSNRKDVHSDRGYDDRNSLNGASRMLSPQMQTPRMLLPSMQRAPRMLLPQMQRPATDPQTQSTTQ